MPEEVKEDKGINELKMELGRFMEGNFYGGYKVRLSRCSLLVHILFKSLI